MESEAYGVIFTSCLYCVTNKPGTSERLSKQYKQRVNIALFSVCPLLIWLSWELLLHSYRFSLLRETFPPKYLMEMVNFIVVSVISQNPAVTSSFNVFLSFPARWTTKKTVVSERWLDVLLSSHVKNKSFNIHRVYSTVLTIINALMTKFVNQVLH